MVTLDYSLPDLSCEKLIKEVKNFNPEIPIIIVSGQEDVFTAELNYEEQKGFRKKLDFLSDQDRYSFE